MSGFDEFALPKALQKAVDELKFDAPTPIQERAFPVIMSGRDVLGIAQTGTGKTLAYLLPLFKLYTFSKSDNPKILILVPTRELVVQVTETVTRLTRYMSVRTLALYGGVNINTQKTAVYQGVDVVVGTPGRVMDLALDNVLRLDEVQRLVIDEFDEMLSLGFRPQITSILTMVRAKRQNILFSATMTDEVDDLIEDYFDFPYEVSLARSGTPLEKIRQWGYHVPNYNTKVNLLQYLLNSDSGLSRLLIFVNNKRIAEMLHDRLDVLFPGEFGVIHSNKTQNYRLQTMEQFRSGDLRGLITTDVMARGLDISDITHVINFEMPEVAEQYIHRIGRTGRAEAEGNAISFVSPRDEERQIEAELLMNQELEILELPAEIEISKELIGPEKEKERIKFLTKKPKLSTGGAFHEKKEKNKKINLGGPSKTKKKTGTSVNRNILKNRAGKKKK